MTLNFHHKKILIAPLDWGLGHATRCIPIIHALLENKNEVIIAADGAIEKLLQDEFPHLRFVKLFNYNIRYSSSGLTLWWTMLNQIRHIFASIKNEKLWLNELLANENFDVIISDNRYGLHSEKAKSIFITHQLQLKMPKGFGWLEKFTKKQLSKLIEPFDECWIPDFEEEEKSLSGVLSHHKSSLKNLNFIGPLSRFEKLKSEVIAEVSDLLILISGPEPQRSIFEKIVFNQLNSLSNFQGNIIVVGGNFSNQPNDISLPDFVEYYSSLNAKSLCSKMIGAKKIVCRSGYSTLMDLYALNKTALLIPTPGQTEQEYLAEFLSSKIKFETVTQSKFELEKIL